jgi:hypothetical protein
MVKSKQELIFWVMLKQIFIKKINILINQKKNQSFKKKTQLNYIFTIKIL